MKSFFNLPRLNLKEARRGITKSTIALIGSKVVTESMHPSKGMKRAPDIIRNVSQEFTGYLPKLGIDLHLKDVIDLGNYGTARIGQAVKTVLERKGTPFVIGGDHATTYFALKDVDISSILWLDAHTDLAKEEEIPHAKEISHGSALKLLVEKGAKAVVMGFRGYSTVKKEIKRAEKLGVEIYPYPFREGRLINFLEECQALSLDLDFFTGTDFPAVRVPEIYGPQVSDFIQILREAHLGPSYIDVIEYLPSRDPNRYYAILLSQILLELLGQLLQGKQNTTT